MARAPRHSVAGAAKTATKLQGLTEILGMDEQSPVYRALINRIHAIREFQTNEGLTLLDINDALETHQYSFGGLSEMILQFGEQIAGATGIPLVRLFGQSPAGLNATGESDLRMYYDTIAHRQELQFRSPLDKILRLTGQRMPEPQTVPVSYEGIGRPATAPQGRPPSQISRR